MFGIRDGQFNYKLTRVHCNQDLKLCLERMDFRFDLNCIAHSLVDLKE